MEVPSWGDGNAIWAIAETVPLEGTSWKHQAHEADSPRRPLLVEGVYLVCGRRRLQLMHDPLGGKSAMAGWYERLHPPSRFVRGTPLIVASCVALVGSVTGVLRALLTVSGAFLFVPVLGLGGVLMAIQDLIKAPPRRTAANLLIVAAGIVVTVLYILAISAGPSCTWCELLFEHIE